LGICPCFKPVNLIQSRIQLRLIMQRKFHT
jgi:hypothetical protein